MLTSPRVSKAWYRAISETPAIHKKRIAAPVGNATWNDLVIPTYDTDTRINGKLGLIADHLIQPRRIFEPRPVDEPPSTVHHFDFKPTLPQLHDRMDHFITKPPIQEIEVMLAIQRGPCRMERLKVTNGIKVRDLLSTRDELYNKT